ncbi:MAG: site-specific integrase [Flavipsychrobacter sp.]|nr:site-specific integrase [Flavipsychrobacter sp.]
MSITFKFLLNKRREAQEGNYPIILRVYEGANYKELSLKIKIHEQDWCERQQLVLPTNESFEIHNAKILGYKSKVQKLILLAELGEQKINPAEVINILVPKAAKAEARTVKASIIKYGEEQVKALTESGKVGNAFAYSCAINKLKAFVKNRDLSFEDLTFKMLNDFNNAMLVEGIKVNSISVYMRTIRAIYNRAINEGIVPSTLYPFAAFKIKNERTVSRTLTTAEFKAIVNLELPVNTPIWHWRNYFMLSFCFRGINFADLLTLRESNIIDGRVIFRRKKTGKIYSIKIDSIAESILQGYRRHTNPDGLILPVLKQTKDLVKLKKDIWQAIKTCNEYLQRIADKCSIEKGITTYYARYSWANIARSLGYSKDMIAEGLGHEYGNRVTGIYLDNYDNDVIDAMNEAVIRSVM